MKIKFTPQFFDIFGFFGFVYITGISLWLLNKDLHWPFLILLCIGVLGMIIDGTIIYKFFIKRIK